MYFKIIFSDGSPLYLSDQVGHWPVAIRIQQNSGHYKIIKYLLQLLFQRYFKCNAIICRKIINNFEL